MTTKRKAIAVASLCALLLSACIGLVGHMYRTDIPWPWTTLKVTIFQTATYQMAYLHIQTGRNAYTTASILRGIQLEKDLGQAEWNELMDDHQVDVGQQLDFIINWSNYDDYDMFGINKELYPPFELDAVVVICPQSDKCQQGEAFR